MNYGIQNKDGEYFSGWLENQEPNWTEKKSDARSFETRLYAETQALLLVNFFDKDVQRKAVKL